MPILKNVTYVEEGGRKGGNLHLYGDGLYFREAGKDSAIHIAKGAINALSYMKVRNSNTLFIQITGTSYKFLGLSDEDVTTLKHHMQQLDVVVVEQGFSVSGEHSGSVDCKDGLLTFNTDSNRRILDLPLTNARVSAAGESVTLAFDADQAQGDRDQLSSIVFSTLDENSAEQLMREIADARRNPLNYTVKLGENERFSFLKWSISKQFNLPEGSFDILFDGVKLEGDNAVEIGSFGLKKGDEIQVLRKD